MIEIVLREYLENALQLPCVPEVPADPPETFIRIERTGSAHPAPGIHGLTLAVQSYAGSLYSAAALNERVKQAMESVTDLDCIASARLNTDYPFTDPASKRYRWQAVYDITHY